MRTVAAFGPDILEAQLGALLPDFPRVALVAAFSGGGDSLALLAALAALRRRHRRLALRAVHVDHGLQDSSRAWVRACRLYARELRVPIVVRRVTVDCPKGQSLEAAARVARHAAFASLLRADEALLTAHHLEDQAETVLLQLLRGAGIAGLAAMPARAPLGKGWMLRPLLDVPRASLREYARQRGFDWIEDPMNADRRFDRAYVRHELLAPLQARWPAAARSLARTARHAADARQLLAGIAAKDLLAAMDGPDLSVPVLRRLPDDRRRNALRAWIVQHGSRVPETRRLAEIAGPMLAARADAQPRVAWDEGGVRRHGNRLVWEPAGAARGAKMPVEAAQGGSAAVEDWRWQDIPVIELPGARGRIGIRADEHGALDLDLLPPGLAVRWRLGGERLRPRRGGPRRSVKRLLQVAGIAPWERAAVPLVYAADRLVAVGERWIDADFQVSAATRRRGRIVWQQSPRRARPGGANLLT